MTTMDEKFEKWQATHHKLGYYPTQYEAAEAGFLAGASANQQVVIEAIDGLMRTDAQLAETVDGWNEALDALKKQIEEKSS